MKTKDFSLAEGQTGVIATLLHLMTALRKKGIFTQTELDELLISAASITRSVDPNPVNQAAGDFIENVLSPNLKRDGAGVADKPNEH